MFTIARVFTGVYLVFHSFLRTVDFNGFLNKVDVYFENLTVFNFKILYYTAPLVPFEEFALGILLALGLYTRLVLKIGVVLLAYLSLFLVDAGIYSEAICHLIMTIAFMTLYMFRAYNVRSMDYEIRSHSLL